MKKIYLFIFTYACVIGLVGFLFNLSSYDLFGQLAKISSLNFVNPLDEFQVIINSASALSTTNLEWYEYIYKFFTFIIDILAFPILVVKDIFIDASFGFQSVMYILGF